MSNKVRFVDNLKAGAYKVLSDTASLPSGSDVILNNLYADHITSPNISGSFTGSFSGDGSQLVDIPASAITGLNLNQISSGSVSASISEDRGLEVNTSLNVVGPGEFSEKLEVSGSIKADSFIKSGSTSDDVLLGDGTTTSLSGIGGDLNLQDITDNGSTTSNNIKVESSGGFPLATNYTEIKDGSIVLRADDGLFSNTTTFVIPVPGFGNASNTVTFQNTSGTVALTSDIPLNIIDGFGTVNYLSKFSDGNTITISSVYESGSNVGIGTTNPTYTLDITGTARVTGNTDFLTQANSDNSSKVATTAFVQNLIGTIPVGLVFQGTWDASTNTPTLTSSTGTTGHFYIVSVDGSTNLDGITDWKVGDWAVFVEAGATDSWEKIDNSSVLDGEGTGGYLPKWLGLGSSNTLTDSIIYESGSNIGIGTTTPSEKLEVEGNALINNDIYIGNQSLTTRRLYFNSNRFLSFENSGFNVDWYATVGSANFSHKLSFNGTPLFSFHADSSLRIGLEGINKQSLRLQVNATENLIEGYRNAFGQDVKTLKIFTSDPFTTNSSPLDGGDILIESGNGFNGGADGQIRFNTLGGTERMRILSGGNVGIGTTTPSQPLTVEGNISASGDLYLDGAFYDSNNSAGTSGQILSSTATGTDWIDLTDTSGVDGTGSANYITRWENGDTVTTSSIYESGGNIGIGTTSPSQKLDVAGNITLSGQILVADGTAANPSITFANEAGTPNTGIFRSSENVIGISSGGLDYLFQGNVFKRNIGGGVYINSQGNTAVSPMYSFESYTGTGMFRPIGVNELAFSTAGSERMRIDSSGNVGIGTTSPTEKLTVEGNISGSGDLYLNNTLLSNQQNTDVDTGTETIATVLIADYDAAFFDFVIKNGTNLRAGTVYAVHDGTNVEFTETSTSDLGDTSDVTLSVDISGADLRLRATTTSDNWIVRTLVRAL